MIKLHHQNYLLEKNILLKCEKDNHTTENCRQLKYKEEYKVEVKPIPSGSKEIKTITEIANENKIMIITQINNEHLEDESDKFKNETAKLLTDSGADINLIKIKELKGNVEVD